MKRIVFIFCIVVFIVSCHGRFVATQQLQSRIDSLQTQINNSYKLGLGEFMSSIQVHHEKLWFAGTAQNWRLADFEIHEIMEAVDDIKNMRQTDQKQKNCNASAGY